MASKYEQALALSKQSGIPIPDAVAQVRNQAPVSATSAGNQIQYDINKQKRQDMANAGTIPAVGTSVTPQGGQTQAPTPTPPVTSSTTPSGATMTADGTVTPPPVTTTTPTASTPAPVTPTPAPVTTETPKTDVISETKAKNEAQMALNKQQAELKEQERQKVAQENKIASTPTDMQGILNSFIAGTPVAPQKSGNYINAKFQYDQYSKFNAMTPTQLLDNLKQGQIGTEMDKLLSQNANYVQAKGELDKIQKTNNINNSIKSIYGGVTGQTKETPDYLGMVSNDLMTKLGLDKDMTSAEAFSQYVTGDQKIVDYTNQLSNVNRQIADTSKLINDGIKSLKAKKGDMPADALVVLLNSTFKDVNETLTNLNNTKTYLEADLKNASEMAFNRYNAVSKDIDNARTIKNSVISNLIQSQFNLAEKQTEADLANKIAQEALNDPYKAIPAMIEEYKKLGIPFTRSTQQIIQDFETSGKDLATYLSELQGTIQSKPEYKKIQEIQAGQLSDAQKFRMQNEVEDRRDRRNFAQQKELAILNKDLGRQEFLWQLENDPEKKAKALELEQKLNANKSLFDVLGKNVGTYEGNRGYDLAGNLGDPLPAGGNWTVKSIDTAGEQVGSIFLGGKGAKPYGNTVVMQDENGNEIRYSHLQTIGVKPGDVLGFGDIVGTRGNTGNVMGANGEKLTAEQLKAGRGAHLDVEIKSNGKLLSNADQVKYLKSLKAGGDSELSDKKFTQYNQTKTSFKAEPIVKAFEEALIAGGDIIQSLGSANGPGDVGAVFNFMKSLDPTSTVREGEFALAAQSAGVWESFKNIPANKLEGTILTDKQRKDFGKLALKYIESKGKLYDTKYNDMVKVLEQQGIPKSYYPTKMTDYVNQYKTEQSGTNTSSGLTGADLFNEWQNFPTN